MCKLENKCHFNINITWKKLLVLPRWRSPTAPRIFLPTETQQIRPGTLEPLGKKADCLRTLDSKRNTSKEVCGLSYWLLYITDKMHYKGTKRHSKKTRLSLSKSGNGSSVRFKLLGSSCSNLCNADRCISFYLQETSDRTLPPSAQGCCLRKLGPNYPVLILQN